MPEIWPSNLFYGSPEDSICILSDESNGPAISFDSNDLKYPLTPRIRQFNLVQRHVINLTSIWFIEFERVITFFAVDMSVTIICPRPYNEPSGPPLMAISMRSSIVRWLSHWYI